LSGEHQRLASSERGDDGWEPAERLCECHGTLRCANCQSDVSGHHAWQDCFGHEHRGPCRLQWFDAFGLIMKVFVRVVY